MPFTFRVRREFFSLLFFFSNFVSKSFVANTHVRCARRASKYNLFTGICWWDCGTAKMRTKHQHLLSTLFAHTPVICGCGFSQQRCTPAVAGMARNGGSTMLHNINECEREIYVAKENFEWINNNGLGTGKNAGYGGSGFAGSIKSMSDRNLLSVCDKNKIKNFLRQSCSHKNRLFFLIILKIYGAKKRVVWLNSGCAVETSHQSAGICSYIDYSATLFCSVAATIIALIKLLDENMQQFLWICVGNGLLPSSTSSARLRTVVERC